MKIFSGILAAMLAASAAMAADEVAKPNIVYILCDDLGYGDVHALNPERGKIATPNMDRLRAEGMAFTDCHSSSSVCTPSRYSILTGRYNWRSRLQAGVLEGESGPLIAPDRLTVGKFLKQHGYTTAALGKWHLGLQFDKQNFTQPISDGPLQHGFDYFFGIAASLDMPPFVYIENNHFTEVPNVTKTIVRSGPAAPDFEAVDVLPKLTSKAVDYIGKRGGGQAAILPVSGAALAAHAAGAFQSMAGQELSGSLWRLRDGNGLVPGRSAQGY